MERRYDDFIAAAEELEREADLLEAGSSEEQRRFDDALSRLRRIVERRRRQHTR